MKTNQLELDVSTRRKPAKSTATAESIRARRTAGAAFSYACQESNLDDKEISGPLGIDAATFSKIKHGLAAMHGDKIALFCELVGNTIYPDWIAYQIGCGLVMLKSEAERRAEVAEAEKARLAEENALLRNLLQGRA